jgi:hypothetical protein
MAAFTRVNGAAASMEQVGRDLFFKTLTKGSGTVSQADLEAIVAALGATSTITAIGAVTVGTSTAVNVIIEGADIANAANTPITGYTSSDLAF